MHHIIRRGIQRSKIFKDDKDRNHFLNRLGSILLETGTPCYAFALMSKALSGPDGQCSAAIRVAQHGRKIVAETGINIEEKRNA